MGKEVIDEILRTEKAKLNNDLEKIRELYVARKLFADVLIGNDLYEIYPEINRVLKDISQLATK